MTLMYDEACESAAAAARCLGRSGDFEAIGQQLRALDPAVVVVCARGSSGHAGTFLRYLLARDLGLIAAAAMPSIASVYRRRQRMAGALFVAVSQSGRSPDLLRQTEEARVAGAYTLAIVNDVNSPLAALCETVVDIAAGPEQSVAATKSVIASLVASLALTAAWRGDTTMGRAAARLPERLGAAVLLDWSEIVALLAASDRILTVGRGPGLAVASEVALKLGEVAGIAGLAFSSAELAHGPRVLAGPSCPVLGFVQQDAMQSGTLALLQALSAQNATVFAAGGEATPGIAPLPVLPPDHPDADLVTMLATFYVAAEAAARARGRDPDHPPGLHKITETV